MALGPFASWQVHPLRAGGPGTFPRHRVGPQSQVSQAWTLTQTMGNPKTYFGTAYSSALPAGSNDSADKWLRAPDRMSLLSLRISLCPTLQVPTVQRHAQPEWELKWMLTSGMYRVLVPGCYAYCLRGVLFLGPSSLPSLLASLLLVSSFLDSLRSRCAALTTLFASYGPARSDVFYM